MSSSLWSSTKPGNVKVEAYNVALLCASLPQILIVPSAEELINKVDFLGALNLVIAAVCSLRNCGCSQAL